jgi:hypothetical protein
MDCWHDEIDKATTERDLVRNASDYLRLWAPRDLDPITLGLAEMRIESVEDVARVNRWLGDPTLSATTRPTAHVRELADYFSHASARLADLRRVQSYRAAAR